MYFSHLLEARQFSEIRDLRGGAVFDGVVDVEPVM